MTSGVANVRTYFNRGSLIDPPTGWLFNKKSGLLILFESYKKSISNNLKVYTHLFKAIELGEPTISGAKVEADLIKNSKNRTVLIFKKRRRKNSRRKNGHRQQYSLIRINKIFSKDGKLISEAEKIKKETKEIKQEKKESAK